MNLVGWIVVGLVAGGLPPGAVGLHALQRAQGGERLTQHAGGLGEAFECLIERNVRAVGDAHALHGMRIGGDVADCEVGLSGAGGEQGGDRGDGGGVAVQAGLRRVVRGWG